MFSDERRQFLRVDFTAHIILKTSSKSYELEGNSRDISQKGIYINSSVDIPVGTLCDLVVILTGSKPPVTLNITGSVVRNKDDGIAIEFKEMNLESYTHLKNIVKYNNKESV
ncbi:MAG: hypothetical protein CSB21_03120 [Deltaproteobacteria bacterium]|nr:MAG: hypothetical protein CSB21_03120 [Deltaproteobacteria bacterium]